MTQVLHQSEEGQGSELPHREERLRAPWKVERQPWPPKRLVGPQSWPGAWMIWRLGRSMVGPLHLVTAGKVNRVFSTVRVEYQGVPRQSGSGHFEKVTSMQGAAR